MWSLKLSSSFDFWLSILKRLKRLLKIRFKGLIRFLKKDLREDKFTWVF